MMSKVPRVKPVSMASTPGTLSEPFAPALTRPTMPPTASAISPAKTSQKTVLLRPARYGFSTGAASHGSRPQVSRASPSAAGVADDVGDQLDAALGQDPVALGSGGAVGAFGHQLDLEPLRHRPGDLAAQRGGDGDVRLHVPQIAPADLLRLRIPRHGAAQV